MIILVGYATVEGQTRKIAEAVASAIESGGDRALLFDVGSSSEYAVNRPEAAILCAPVNGARYPAAFKSYVQQEVAWLNKVPSAFVSVSMLIRSEFDEEREEAVHFPDAFLKETGWTPAQIHHAAGALRYTEYDFFKRWIIRRMAEHENAPTDVTKDYEFTDWTALSVFVTAFLASAKG